MRDSQIRFIRLLGFPGDEFPDSFYSALMFQPRAVFCVVLVGILTQSAWPFVALSAALLSGTVMTSLNPFDAIYNYAVACRRGLRPLGVTPAPRRFAQGMAGTIAMVIAMALFAKVSLVAWIFEGVLAVASAAVVFKDKCAGADMYYLLRRTLRRTARGVEPFGGSTRA
jgi:hypothetical protein